MNTAASQIIDDHISLAKKRILPNVESIPPLKRRETLLSKAQARKDELLSRVEVVQGPSLLMKHYEEPRYLWQGILPESGICVMAGDKACGKTLLLLQMVHAISRGEPFMGVSTTPTRVHFLELELSQRRTAQRLKLMGIVPTDSWSFSFKWEKGEIGIETLTAFIEQEKIRLLIVDVMQNLWPTNADSNNYQDTYRVLAPIRQMANELGCLILLVTHRRKNKESDDYLDSVIGSVGIAGNADVVLNVMRGRGDENAVLMADGNDIERREISMKFQANPLGFQLSDMNPLEATQSHERREIIDYLREHGPSTTREIATGLNKKDSNISHLLSKLKDSSLIASMGYGKYGLVTPIPNETGGKSIQSIQSTDEDMERLNTFTTLNTPMEEVVEQLDIF